MFFNNNGPRFFSRVRSNFIPTRLIRVLPKCDELSAHHEKCDDIHQTSSTYYTCNIARRSSLKQTKHTKSECDRWGDDVLEPKPRPRLAALFVNRVCWCCLHEICGDDLIHPWNMREERLMSLWHGRDDIEVWWARASDTLKRKSFFVERLVLRYVWCEPKCIEMYMRK